MSDSTVLAPAFVAEPARGAPRQIEKATWLGVMLRRDVCMLKRCGLQYGGFLPHSQDLRDLLTGRFQHYATYIVHTDEGAVTL